MAFPAAKKLPLGLKHTECTYPRGVLDVGQFWKTVSESFFILETIASNCVSGLNARLSTVVVKFMKVCKGLEVRAALGMLTGDSSKGFCCLS